MKKIYLKQIVGYGGEPGTTKTVYEVMKVIGSTLPLIGDVLSKDAVADMCEQTGVWLVTITA